MTIHTSSARFFSFFMPVMQAVDLDVLSSTDTDRAKETTSGIDVIDLACRHFPNFQAQINQLPTLSFMPDEETLWEAKTHRLSDLLRLFYLTSIKVSSTRVPVTQKDAQIFHNSVKANDRTHNWIGWRAFVLYFLLALTNATVSYVGFANIQSSSGNATSTEESEHDEFVNTQFRTSIIAGVVLIVGYITNLCGLYWTGRHPDRSSINANKAQNCTHKLYLELRNISLVLAQLYRSKDYRDLSRSIAAELDVKAISTSFGEITQLDYVHSLIGLDDLQEVVDYIRQDGDYYFRNQTLKVLVLAIPNS
eukprot:TRINITY_DN13112_c0_g1_i1.p1 TRINITY_DN13112_c0_g1~~TRINITY_DN13112_c0_g1_i1.p1  ORF type:complete len:307 (+),score=25.57 TRINITY_DN13112_c0_g1_i1:157-1077(+)